MKLMSSGVADRNRKAKVDFKARNDETKSSTVYEIQEIRTEVLPNLLTFVF